MNERHETCSKCSRDIFIRPRHNAYEYKCFICHKFFHSFCVFIDQKLANRIQRGIDFFTCKSCYRDTFPFHNTDDFELRRTLFTSNIHDFAQLPDLSHIASVNETDDPYYQRISSPYVSPDKFHRCSVPSSDNLSLLHMNLNTLNNPTAFNNLTTFLRPVQRKFNLIAVSETRHNQNTNFNDYRIPGYRTLNNNLTDFSPTRCGGVALYVDSSLNYLPRNDLKINIPHLENVWIEIPQPDNEKNVIIGVLYRHPRYLVDEIEQFTTLLNDNLVKINAENKLCKFTGDLNLNLLNYDTDNSISAFLDMIFSNSFYPCISKPTHIVPDKRPSLIDHIFTNCLPNKVKSGICLYPIADGHLPIFSVIHKKTQRIQRSDTLRDYKKFNESEFKRHLELALADFSEKNKDINDVNLLYSKFNDIVSSTLNLFAPIRTLTKKEQKIKENPWLTKALLKSIKRKAIIYKTHYILGDLIRRNYYKQYCKILKRCIERSKQNYYQTLFSNIQNDTKKVWKSINEIVTIKSKTSESPTLITVDNNNITDPKTMANHFNNFFRNVGPNLAQKIPLTRTHFTEFLGIPNNAEFQLTTCSVDEVKKIIANLKNTKSEGLDNIPTKIIKSSNDILSHHLTRIFNLSITSGVFPDLLKAAKIRPIHKAESRKLLTNYRPISILSPISKILERIVFNQLTTFLSANNILYKYQFGFRKNHSTELALIEISDLIYKALDSSEFFFSLYLDLSKAFDTVNFEILLQKLDHYGIRGLGNQWMRSYLYNRCQRVDIDGQLSEPLIPICGVPQGSILGPLLFLIYINDLPNTSYLLNFRLFADDTKIYLANSSLPEIQEIISTELPKISTWLNANKLSLNVKKTKFVLFKDPHKVEPFILNVNLSDSIIEREVFAKHLGVFFDADMSWVTHSKSVSSKISKAIGSLYKIKNYVNIRILRSIYFAIVYPHLHYGILSWGAASAPILNKIQVKQNRFIKVMYNLGIRTNTNRLYFSHNLLMVNEVYHSKLLRFVHSLHSISLPAAFDNFLLHASTIHNYGTRYARGGNYFVTRIHNIYGSLSPSYVGSRLWAQIPPYAKSFNKDKFKDYAFTYLIARYA